VKSILVDAGPLIALFDRSDAHHANVRDLIRDIPAQLITTWPVVTEVSHMLDFDVRAQLDFLRWVSAEGVTLYEIDDAGIERIIELTSKYQDRPMDLADASLVIAAERLKLYEVISIDRDFDIYRTADRKHIRNVYLERE
jgi:predicted nucleic acid-binding protein